MIYQQFNDGISAVNWTTGEMVWHYEDIAKYQFENPYTGENGSSVVPMYNFGYGMRIVDGKIYVANAIHSPQVPLERGWGVHAINALTGEQVWRVSISSHTHAEAATGYVHDGYFTFFGGDGIMYVFGKGRSATTVQAPSTEIQVGQKLTITGTVLDMSPAQPGTAAISDEDIDEWMEYLHRQFAKPADAKGVPVKLTAIDPNGNTIDIGTATSDINGVYGFSWAPEVPGLYQIIATFAGSASYGSSTASTYFTAVEAPPIPVEPEFPAQVDNTMTVVGVGVAILAAIAVVGILLYRKKP